MYATHRCLSNASTYIIYIIYMYVVMLDLARLDLSLFVFLACLSCLLASIRTRFCLHKYLASSNLLLYQCLRSLHHWRLHAASRRVHRNLGRVQTPQIERVPLGALCESVSTLDARRTRKTPPKDRLRDERSCQGHDGGAYVYSESTLANIMRECE